ncbi:hypothetical protein REPUB_Repub08aG0121500 [Reevesia pubescens]
MKKPMLVLKKIKCMVDVDLSDEATSSNVELDVAGVIRHNILFKTRPTLISGSHPIVKEKANAAAAQKQSV